ncbi:MAG: 2-deoxy-5-keto-D-gluconate 6-phosphate aldolase domain-containing protein [Microgenomates group bacterium]
MDISSFTKGGRFLMLALDHRESFRKILNPQKPEAVTTEEIIEIKKEIIESLHDQFSGILIDPEYGLPAYQSLNFRLKKPYLLSIEKSGYRQVGEERITQLEYQVGQLKKMAATGVKLLIYFNPYVKTAKTQLETAAKVWRDCQAAGLPLFLEIVTYYTEQTASAKLNLVVESVKRFLNYGIRADVFKLDYPKNEASCRLITNLLGRIPWVLLTRGENFQIFKKQLEIAVENGASGFLAGRALWQEIGKYQNEEERKEFLNAVVKQRFQEITSIVEKRAFFV